MSGYGEGRRHCCGLMTTLSGVLNRVAYRGSASFFQLDHEETVALATSKGPFPVRQLMSLQQHECVLRGGRIGT